MLPPSTRAPHENGRAGSVKKLLSPRPTVNDDSISHVLADALTREAVRVVLASLPEGGGVDAR